VIKINKTYSSLKELFDLVNLPKNDLNEILEKIAGIREEDLLAGDITISNEKLALALEAIAQRLAHQPLAQILGEKFFWEDSFVVNSYTLIPRPESERLLEEMIKATKAKFPNKNEKIKLLDLGTGSGCLVISLVKELLKLGYQPEALALDISPQALAIAKKNCERLLGDKKDLIEFLQASWEDLARLKPNEKFDLIVSNPPYIPSKDLFKLDKSVKDYEPRLALDGGVDGLDKYREIIAFFKQAKNALLGLEIGYNQASKLRKLLSGYDTKLFQDLQGLDRVILAQ
jgi:release factor glutamine methyltransferase